MRPSTRASHRVVACLSLLAAVAGCATSSTSTPVATSSTSTPVATSSTSTPVATSSTSTATGAVVSGAYRAGMAATLRLPAATGPADLVVLVPGGGWQTADPAGLVPLAERLTGDGDTTATVTYGTTSTGATFPQPVDDVACAIRWSASQARANGRPPRHVVVLGHSAGGQLAALVALSGRRFGSSCRDPAVSVDALVGIAGVYAVRQAADLAVNLFGAPLSAAAQEWRDGDPLWWATSGNAIPAGLRVLLLYGSADNVVPLAQTTTFAAALRRRGVDVTEQVLDGQDHLSVFQAPTAGPPVERWLAAGR